MTRGPAPVNRAEITGPALAAWQALRSALDRHRPGCRGDGRFTADEHSADDLADMRALCASCPVLAACRDFADAAPPRTMAGYWAGRKHSTGRTDYQPRQAREGAA